MNLLKKWLRPILTLFKNKNQHGFKRYCSSGKCKICQTEWPKHTKTITENYLDSLGYYKKLQIAWSPLNKDNLKRIFGVFNGGYLILPKGLKGEEILAIAEKLKPEYNKMIKGDLEEESKKISRLQGFNEEK